jgi:DNA (cytosine-5)-methyltransferase 1
VVLRRFTPLEFARLQGLDDDWLDGPKRGGKPLPDGDRYRLLGNAFPVPVAAWVLER